MTSNAAAAQPGKINFKGMVGAKRRRMSGGSSKASDSQTDLGMDNDDDEKTTQTCKCKGATTIPIFLKSEYPLLEPKKAVRSLLWLGFHILQDAYYY